MTRVLDVPECYADFDSRHPDDRLRLFAAVAAAIDPTRVLYPGSYIDIAPSVSFEDVTYVDVDRRAARFFARADDVAALVEAKRTASRAGTPGPPTIAFHHLDYTDDLPIEASSIDLLISLYAGFVSEHCTRYVRRGGHLLVNPSHGDASMAALDPRYRLVGVVVRRADRYTLRTNELDTYLIPKRGTPPSRSELHRLGRGIAYTRSPYAYLFERLE